MPASRPVALADAELLRRLLQGDSSAGDEVVRRYFEPLMRYLQRLAGGQAAEELHQQTWLSVLANAASFDPSNGAGNFKAWLFRIATNKVKDHWRSMSREKAATQGLSRIPDERTGRADGAAEAREESHKLHTLIAQLPEAQREALLLRYYGDLKFTEIAELTGCPLNTALTRVHKALLKLRQLMEQPLAPAPLLTGPA